MRSFAAVPLRAPAKDPQGPVGRIRAASDSPVGDASAQLRRVIVQQFDPYTPVPGGIDTCIRGLLRYADPGAEFWIVGVDASGHEERSLGVWTTVQLEGRTFQFCPVARLNPADQSRRIPHTLRLAAGMLRYVRHLPNAAVIQTHRLDMGVICGLRWRDRRHVQFLHIDGHDSFRTGSDSFWKLAPSIYAFLERTWLRRADDVVVFNEKGSARLSTHAPGTRYSTTWFDPDIFSPTEDEPAEPHTVLWVGRVEPPKDPLLALEVLRGVRDQFADARLLVVGDGTLLPELRRAAATSGLAGSVAFTGALPRAEVAQAMRRSGCLLLTSHYEGFPRVMLEALACGTPVVSTPGGDPSRFLAQGVNGIRTVARSAEELAQAVVEAAGYDRQAVADSVRALSAPVVVKRVLGEDRGSVPQAAAEFEAGLRGGAA